MPLLLLFTYFLGAINSEVTVVILLCLMVLLCWDQDFERRDKIDIKEFEYWKDFTSKKKIEKISKAFEDWKNNNSKKED